MTAYREQAPAPKKPRKVKRRPSVIVPLPFHQSAWWLQMAALYHREEAARWAWSVNAAAGNLGAFDYPGVR